MISWCAHAAVSLILYIYFLRFDFVFPTMKPDLASFKEFEYKDLSIQFNTGILFNLKLYFASFTISQVSKCIIGVSSFTYIYVLYGNIENGGVVVP